MVSTALTSGGKAGFPWWGWLLLGLLFCCLSCCIFLLCYSRRQRAKIIYHRRGGVDIGKLDSAARKRLGS